MRQCKCVSELISFVTGKAPDKSLKEKRKTINGDDLLWSMTTLGFTDYVEPLKVYLQGFREIEGERTGLGRPQTGGEGGEHLRDAVGGDGDGLYSGVLEYQFRLVQCIVFWLAYSS